MAFALLMCSAVIVLCILTNRFLKRFGIPAVLIFIGLGMLFGSEGIVKIPFDNFQMAETICCTALIFIMFYGGFGTSYREAKPILPKAVLLSTVGILITAGLTGLFCYYVVGMSLQEGLLVGAVLSSTDAASVFSILRSKKLNLKEGTASLLEVESGSNDPFAYMLTIIILNWMAGDGENIVLLVVEEVGLGLLFGAGLGLLAVKILKNVELEAGGIDTILMIAFVLFSYAAPVLIGGNGYLSVDLFGFIVGNARFKSRVSLVHFFESIDHLAQMLIFFLLGLLVFPSMLLPILGTAVLVFLGLTFIARPVAVFLVMTPFRSSWRQQALTAFAGLRGAASAVFAIIAVVSPGYAGYNVYNIVFCVAIISVAFQGLLLPFAAEKLDMVDDSQNVMKTFSDYQDDQEMQLIQIRLTPGHRYIGKRLKELNMGGYVKMLGEVCKAYPNFKVIATTLRTVITATVNSWKAICYADGKIYHSIEFPALEILDRVGGGDSFASGLIYGLMTYEDAQKAVNYGAVHGALAMTTPGDTSMASLKEVEAKVNGGSARVQR